MASDETTEIPYEVCVRGPTDDQPVRLKLGLREPVAHFLSHMAERYHATPEEVFLVVDGNLSEALLPFAHKPDLANSYPVAQLVPHGGTVGVQIGRSGASAFGPFILGPPAAAAPAAVGVDTFEITRVTAMNGARQTSEAEVTRTNEKIHAVISHAFADGEGTRQHSRIMTGGELARARKLDIMEDSGVLKDLSPEAAWQKFMDL